jgi:hypothetical protein
MPTSLHPVYDAMILGQTTEVAVLQQHGVAATNDMPSPSPQSPVAVCHHCGSAPLDMASLTETMSSSSAASLLWTYQFRTDTHVLSSRLASPMRPSVWADYASANEPDDTSIDQDFPLTEEHITEASNNMPLLSMGTNPFDHFGGALLSELEVGSNWQKGDTHTFATGTSNIFLPGLYGCYAESQWMPSSPTSSPTETDTTLTGATLCGSTLCSPVLCDDSVDLFTPWAGTKQVSLVGTAIVNPKLLGQRPMSFTLLKAVANFTLR